MALDMGCYDILPVLPSAAAPLQPAPSASAASAAAHESPAAFGNVSRLSSSITILAAMTAGGPGHSPQPKGPLELWGSGLGTKLVQQHQLYLQQQLRSQQQAAGDALSSGDGIDDEPQQYDEEQPYMLRTYLR